MKYSIERKESVLKKMMPPYNRSIRQIAGEEDISEGTLYNWRTSTGPLPGCGNLIRGWMTWNCI